MQVGTLGLSVHDALIGLILRACFLHCFHRPVSAQHRVYLTYKKLFTPAFKFSQCTLTALDKGCYCHTAGAQKQAVKTQQERRHHCGSSEMSMLQQEEEELSDVAVLMWDVT